MDQDPLWKYDYRTRTLWESEVEKARPGWINQSDGTVRCRCVVSPLPPGEYTARSEHWEPYAEDFAADDWYIV